MDALWQKHTLGTSEGVCIRRTPTDNQTLEVTVRVVTQFGTFEAEGKET